MMSEKRFKIRYGTISTNYPSGRIFDNKKQHSLYLDEVVDLLNEQQTTINKQDKEIKQLKCMNNQLERRLDYSIAYDMRECE